MMTRTSSFELSFRFQNPLVVLGRLCVETRSDEPIATL